MKVVAVNLFKPLRAMYLQRNRIDITPSDNETDSGAYSRPRDLEFILRRGLKVNALIYSAPLHRDGSSIRRNVEGCSFAVETNGPKWRWQEEKVRLDTPRNV